MKHHWNLRSHLDRFVAEAKEYIENGRTIPYKALEDILFILAMHVYAQNASDSYADKFSDINPINIEFLVQELLKDEVDPELIKPQARIRLMLGAYLLFNISDFTNEVTIAESKLVTYLAILSLLEKSMLVMKDDFTLEGIDETPIIENYGSYVPSKIYREYGDLFAINKKNLLNEIDELRKDINQLQMQSTTAK
jgi:hypothetical protein